MSEEGEGWGGDMKVKVPHAEIEMQMLSKHLEAWVGVTWRWEVACRDMINETVDEGRIAQGERA